MSVASHQLTPFALIGALVALVVFRRIRPWGLPVLMIVLASAWLVFVATTFLDGRLAALLAEVASPGDFTESNVAGRLRGSPGHVLVVQGRLVFSLAIWGLAFVGGLRRLRGGRLDLSLALLALAPFGLILAQGYGGEMILRVFLFGVPFMAFFAAAVFFPTVRPASWGLVALIVVASTALAAGQLFARYGNEKADMVTVGDYQAWEYVKSVAEPGSMLAAPNSRIALEYRAFEQYRYPDLWLFWTESDLTDPEDLQALQDNLAERNEPGQNVYVIATRGTQSHAELNWGWTEEQWNEYITGLASVFDIIYQNEDATVFRWTVPEPQAP